MSFDLFIRIFASSLLPRLPLLLMWIAILIITIVNWRKYPKVSLFTLIGVLGIMIISLIGIFISAGLPVMMNSQGKSSMAIGQSLVIWGIVSSILDAGFWGLIVAAIFGWRKQVVNPPAYATPPSIQTPPAL